MLGKLLVSAAVILGVMGVIAILAEKYPWFKLGRLPGDILIERDGTTILFPITTMLLLSLLVTIGFTLLRYVKR